MTDFFLSYTQADRDWAEWIAWILEEKGYTTIIQPASGFSQDQARAGQAGREAGLSRTSPSFPRLAEGKPHPCSAPRRDPGPGTLGGRTMSGRW